MSCEQLGQPNIKLWRLLRGKSMFTLYLPLRLIIQLSSADSKPAVFAIYWWRFGIELPLPKNRMIPPHNRLIPKLIYPKIEIKVS